MTTGDISSFSEQRRLYAKPSGQHLSLGGPLRSLLFLIPLLIFAFLIYHFLAPHSRVGVIPIIVAAAIVIWTLVSGVRVAAQWERGIVLRLGRFLAVKGPGIVYVVPILDYVRFVDTRTLTLNIPRQKVITKDNVPAQIDGVLYYLVTNPEQAVMRVQDYAFAIAQSAQASLRDVVGGLSLDELLSEREQIQQQIGLIVEKHIKEWGLHVDSIRLQDIELPEELKKMMSRQASAEREKRATITKAEGDKLAALNLAAAAHTMMSSPGAMQLRSLQTIDGLGASASNTVVLFPVEWVQVARVISDLTGGKMQDAAPGGEGAEAGGE